MVLRTCSWLFAQGSLLVVLQGLYGEDLAACSANTLTPTYTICMTPKQSFLHHLSHGYLCMHLFGICVFVCHTSQCSVAISDSMHRHHSCSENLRVAGIELTLGVYKASAFLNLVLSHQPTYRFLKKSKPQTDKSKIMHSKMYHS